MAEPIRTTFRVNGNFFNEADCHLSQDAIYYVMTETPHLADFSFFGPFKCLEVAVPSIRYRLQQTSHPGLDTFDELIMSAGPNALTSLHHFTAPLQDGGVMVIHFIKEKNAEVAATLPGPAWIVICAELVLPQPTPRGGLKLKGSTICRTFVSAEEANQAARQIAADELQRMRGGRQSEKMKSSGTVCVVVMSPTKGLVMEAI
jgi:hypothetical protein